MLRLEAVPPLPKPFCRVIKGQLNGILKGLNAFVLLALANGAELLPKMFGRKEIRSRKKRIKQVVDGEMIREATKEVIEACQAAVMVAVIMAVLTSVNTSN